MNPRTRENRSLFRRLQRQFDRDERQREINIQRQRDAQQRARHAASRRRGVGAIPRRQRPTVPLRRSRGERARNRDELRAQLMEEAEEIVDGFRDAVEEVFDVDIEQKEEKEEKKSQVRPDPGFFLEVGRGGMDNPFESGFHDSWLQDQQEVPLVVDPVAPRVRQPLLHDLPELPSVRPVSSFQSLQNADVRVGADVPWGLRDFVSSGNVSSANTIGWFGTNDVAYTAADGILAMLLRRLSLGLGVAGDIRISLSFQNHQGNWRRLPTITWPLNLHTRSDVTESFEQLLRVLRSLVAMFRERYDDDEWNLIGDTNIILHFMPSPHGSCDTFEHKRFISFENEHGHTLSVPVLSPKSSGGDCAIACILKWYSLKYSSHQEYQCTVKLLPSANQIKCQLLNRKEGDTNGISVKDLDIISSALQVQITVLDTSFVLIHTTPTSFEVKCRLMLDERLRHYFLVLDDNIKIKETNHRQLEIENRCHKCHVIIRMNHRCSKESLEEHQRRLNLANLELINLERTCDPNRLYDELFEAIFKDGCHVLMTGPAGCGKTFTMKRLNLAAKSKGLNEDEFVILSSTGVSAIEVGGQILHQFFGIGCMSGNLQKLFEKVLRNQDVRTRVLSVQVVVIDEISMVGAHTFEFINKICQHIRKDSQVFGGIKLIMSGDFLQLPPVSDPLYVFESSIWPYIEDFLYICFFSKSIGKRYTCERFASMMTRLRRGLQSLSDIKTFKSRVYSLEQCHNMCTNRGLIPTVLFPLRRQVDTYNRSHLSNLRGESITINSKDNWNEHKVKAPPFVLKALPCDTLLLKVGAQVMCTTNTWSNVGIVNGTAGVVVKINASLRICDVYFPSIKKNMQITAIKHSCKTGRFTFVREQLPLVVSWAMTIHKSQGKTIDAVIVDAGKTNFASSQIYVALSRVRKVEDLFLLSFDPMSVKVNPRALRFDKWCSVWHKDLEDYYFPQEPKDPILNSFSHGQQFTSTLFQVRDTVTSCLVFQPKKPYHELLLNKTLFYDYETYFNPSTKVETAYFNHLKLFLNGREYESKTFCYVCDPSKDVNQLTFDYIMDLIIRMKDEYIEKKGKYGFREQEKFLQAPLFICAYNGSGFDFHFFMQSILKSQVYAERFESTCTLKGSKIISFNIWDKYSQTRALCTHDIFNITGCSLSNAAKDFLSNKDGHVDLDKDTFPHQWVTKENLMFAKGHEFVSLVIDDFPESMREKVQSQVNKGLIVLDRYPFHRLLHSYGPKDVDVMIAVYKKMEALTQEAVGTGILRFITLSKLTWYGFRHHLPNRYLQSGSFNCKNKYQKRYTKIYRTNLAADKKISQSIIGGKCYPRIMNFVSPDVHKSYDDIKDYYVYADIISMYVSIMMKCDLPYGLEKNLVAGSKGLKEIIERKNWDPKDPLVPFCVLDVTFELHPHELEPCVSRKVTKNNCTKLCWDTVKRRQWITSIDLFLILRNKGKVFEINEAYIWPHRGPLFKEWVTKTFNEKQKAAKEGRKAAKQYYKTAGNGCYGSSLQRTFNDTTILIRDYEDLCKFHNQYEWTDTLNQDNWEKGLHEVLVLKGQRKRHDLFEWTSRPRYMGSFILAWSRYLLDTIIEQAFPSRRDGDANSVQSQFLYGDTDSLLIHSSCLRRIKDLFGKEAGQLGDDLYSDWSWDEKRGPRFAKVVRYTCGAPKSYAVQAVVPPELAEKVEYEGKAMQNGSVKYKGKSYYFDPNSSNCLIDTVKLKGITHSGFEYMLNGKCFDHLSYNQLKAIIDGKNGEDGKVVVLMKNRLLRNGVNVSYSKRSEGIEIFSIQRHDIERTLFKSQWEGRRVLGDTRFTVPHGWVSRDSEVSLIQNIASKTHEEEEDEEDDSDGIFDISTFLDDPMDLTGDVVRDTQHGSCSSQSVISPSSRPFSPSSLLK